MLTLRSMRHTRTSRNIKSFRSCRQNTGEPCVREDQTRIAREGKRLGAREAQRRWLADQWAGHFEAVAGPLRALPPSARSRQTKGR